MHSYLLDSRVYVRIYRSLGKVHSWNFSSEKISCFLFNGKIFHVLNFHPSRLQMKIF